MAGKIRLVKLIPKELLVVQSIVSIPSFAIIPWLNAP